MIRVLNVQQDKVEGGGIRQFLCLLKYIILKSSMILVLNVQQDNVVWGGIRQFLSRKGDQNSLRIHRLCNFLYQID